MSNIFETLDTQWREEKSLYPYDILPFLEEFFQIIDVPFKKTDNLLDLLKDRTKEEYELLLNFLSTEFIKTIENDRSSWWKFIISKLLEWFIFKYLDLYHYYNYYHDPEKLWIKKQLTNFLSYIYDINSNSPLKVQENDITKILFDWEVYISRDEIKRFLQSTVKKEKFLYEYGPNRTYCDCRGDRLKNYCLPNFNDLLWREVIFDSTTPTIDKIFLEDLNTITNFLCSQEVTQKKNIIREYIFSSLLNYSNKVFDKGGQLHEVSPICKFYLNVNLNNFKLRFKDGDLHSLYYEDEEINLIPSPNYMNYYLSLFITSFTRYSQVNPYGYSKTTILEDRDEVFTQLIKQGLTNNNLGVECYPNIERPNFFYEKFKWYKLIKEIEYKWRIYKWQHTIYTLINRLDDNEIFKVTFEDQITLLLTKNLNFSYLLNTQMFDKLVIEGQEFIVWQTNVILKPSISNGLKIQEYIDTFLDETYEDYEYEYQDMLIDDLFKNKKFTKTEIQKLTKEFTDKYLDFEKDINFSKLIVKDLSD